MMVGLWLAFFATWIEVSGGAWTPTDDLMTQVRSQLRPFVERAASNEGKTLPEWDTYTFQYQGRVEHGRKVLYISAMCQVSDDVDLHKQFLIIFDGGACNFSVIYDPVKREFFALHFEGEA